jgi:hypothetical protein
LQREIVVQLVEALCNILVADRADYAAILGDVMAVGGNRKHSAAGPPNGAPNAAAGNIRQPLFHGDFSQYIID